MKGDSCETWDSVRVLGGWTGGPKVNPHDYIHGGSGRQTQERSLGWEGGDVATRRTYAPKQYEAQTGTRARLVFRCVAGSLLPSGKPDIAGTRQHERPTGPLPAPPAPCGCAGSIATGSAVAGLRIRRSSWICGASGCTVARRNEKPAERRALRKPWCEYTLDFG